MKHKPLFFPALPLAMVFTCATLSVASGQPAPEIVSAWKYDDGDFLVVFRYDGSYSIVDADEENPGLERGTFEWDKDSGSFSVNTLVDTNGDAGFSHPGSATSISISGNSLTYNVAGDGSYAFSRVQNTSSAIVGSWIIPGEKFAVTFLSDGSYFLAVEANDIPSGCTGIEKGSYTWNPTSKTFTATADIDTNGDVGVNGTIAASGVTINIDGNTLVFDDGEESTTLLRLTTNPTPLRLPEFEVTRFAYYDQTSNGAPVLAPFDPFFAQAYLDSSIGAFAPTLKIGNGAPITLDPDGEGGFEFGEGFATLAALDSFLPAASSIQFKDGGAIADLSTAATNTFPTVPKILVREGDLWVGGVYRFGEDEVLQWTLPTGFDSSQYVANIEVYDISNDIDVIDVILQGEVTHFDLAGKLEPGNLYEVELEFYRIDSSTTTGTGVFSANQGYVLSVASTLLTVRSLPDNAQEPSIYEHPESQTGTPGAPILLQVGINEDAFRTSAFQWLKNDVELPGQTGNSLYIPAFDPVGDSGSYHVVVSNPNGTATSNPAVLGEIDEAVTVLGINRRRVSIQQGAATLLDNGANFTVYVEGNGISPTFPSASMNLAKPGGTLVPLELDDDRWSIDTEFLSLASMLASYPNGSYQIKIGTDTIPVSMAAGVYPNQPVVTSSAGTWSQGKLQITASQAAAGFTLTTNTSNGDGFITLGLFDEENETLIDIDGPGVPSEGIVANIPANLLQSGSQYEVEVEFDEIIDDFNASAFSWAASGGTTAFGVLSSETFLTIEVIADPAGTPYSTWQAGFFSEAELANPAISGGGIDFDKDGIPNLLEYLFGGNPRIANSNLLPAIGKPPGSNNLVFTYRRKIAATGVTQVIEHGGNLSSTWSVAVHGENGVTISTASVPGDSTVEQVTATIPATGTSRFVRLKAVR